jgi:uncharacterized protein (DUF2236 family)
MRPFIDTSSIVRRIWSDPDVILLIFAGGAAEFALNRAVDWLFFTNRLPKDPIGRLFSTVHYAQRIVFASEQDAHDTLARINAVHRAVERARGQRIADWAHRDVLYMLIDYSQRAYEMLHGSLTTVEQDDLYEGFLRVGHGLNVECLPATFAEWQTDRARHLERDLVYSEFTRQLFEQYRKHLGWWRYQLLLDLQALLVPAHVRALLRLSAKPILVSSGVSLYALIARTGLQEPTRRMLIPRAYWHQVHGLSAPT